MLVHNTPLLSIYFGNADDNVYPPAFGYTSKNQSLLAIQPYSKLQKLININFLIFLQQVHSTAGIVVDEPEFKTFKPFTHEGDFLMTKLPHVGLGIMTADCLPIIFFDKANHAVAIAHAGWRGSVAGIAKKTVERMQQAFKTNPKNIDVFFGPCAKMCCYEVGTDFVSQLDDVTRASQVLKKRGGRLFFDVLHYNQLQLEGAGVKKEALGLDYNVCTICDANFFSYRRQKENAGRQMTVVSLK